MLFRKTILDRIETGEITLAFRVWKRPTVRAGGSLRTSVGVLAITELAEVTWAEITQQEFRQAGYASEQEAKAELIPKPDARLFRIRFHREGNDPRLTLREQDAISNAEMESIGAKLDRLDRTAGLRWTRPALAIIASNEGLAATQIAARLGLAKDRLKAGLRQVKELGLTESLTTGYRLSPRGHVYLRMAGVPEAADAGASLRRS
ncbi:hypothetical protein [Rhizobium sp. BK251]|uniref:hypothetical protein n=1 Tax=Rhizobium sp. BK251 TaxID=2512125 RepID=UPI0010445212|nr:hypothetical protein [Rhizobium sp. BK251]TCL75023.1 hypothetical protein EV286_102588 [Rhizobium sp. BK251]